jgi:hypothetical protein
MLSDYLLRPGAPGLLERDPETNRALAAELRALLAVEKEARLMRYRLPCMFVWRAHREGKIVPACPDVLTEYLPEHAWCPVCRALARLGLEEKEKR